MNEQTLKVISRLKQTGDGMEFISYLNQLSKDNYELWKDVGGDVLRGRAMALDELIKVFDKCDDRLSNQKVEEKDWL